MNSVSVFSSSDHNINLSIPVSYPLFQSHTFDLDFFPWPYSSPYISLYEIILQFPSAFPPHWLSLSPHAIHTLYFSLSMLRFRDSIWYSQTKQLPNAAKAYWATLEQNWYWGIGRRSFIYESHLINQFVCFLPCSHYMRQIMEALRYCHDNDIIHRDIKVS